ARHPVRGRHGPEPRCARRPARDDRPPRAALRLRTAGGLRTGERRSRPPRLGGRRRAFPDRLRAATARRVRVKKSNATSVAHIRRRHDMTTTDGTPTYTGVGDPATRFTDYYPAWLDSLADDVTIEGSLLDGAAQGPEAVRTIVVAIRELYEHQEFNFA